MGWREISSALDESQTVDESFQLVTGYGYASTGRYTFGLEHPPLLKLLFGLSILDLRPNLPAAFPREPRDGGDPKVGTDFLYRNRASADIMLFRGRLVAVTISLVLGLALVTFAARWFGRGAALAALTLYTLDPNFLAHGHLIKNDVAAALGIFAVIATWHEYLISRRTSWLLSCGALFGLALSVKFSALVLVPVLFLLGLVRIWQSPGEWGALRFTRALAIVAGSAFFVVWSAYRFEIGTPASAGLVEKARKIELAVKAARAVPFLTRRALVVAGHLPLPAPLFFRGIVAIGHMNAVGRETYVLGTAYSSPPWFYSPVVLAVKTPLAVLGMGVAALALAFRRRMSGTVLANLDRLRATPFVWIVTAASPLLYMAMTASIRINSGVRSLLPAYPFAFVVIAAILTHGINRSRIRQSIMCVGILGLLAESLLIDGHYLSFFNAAAGGPSNGPKYLLDSSLDWGQDMKHLARWARSAHPDRLCLSYYGLAEPDYYGISSTPLPPTASLAELKQLNCVVAVSATNLFHPPSPYPELRSLRPLARIGNTIYVYDPRASGGIGTGP